MRHYKYVGKPNPEFDGEGYFTVQFAFPEFGVIKLTELAYDIHRDFFLDNFEEIPETDPFYDRLTKYVLLD